MGFQLTCRSGQENWCLGQMHELGVYERCVVNGSVWKINLRLASQAGTTVGKHFLGLHGHSVCERGKNCGKLQVGESLRGGYRICRLVEPEKSLRDKNSSLFKDKSMMRNCWYSATAFMLMAFAGSIVYADGGRLETSRTDDRVPTAMDERDGERIRELESGDIIWGAEGDDFWAEESGDFLHGGKCDIWQLEADDFIWGLEGDDFWAEESGDFLHGGKCDIWQLEADDFIWELEGDDFWAEESGDFLHEGKSDI